MSSSRPDIILIITDQQSASMMSCAGNRHVRTAAMDSLAASGVRFERAYCTDPVCVPSRFSLMTGRMPSEIGLRSNESAHLGAVPEAVKGTGLGWLVRQAGYDAAYAGKVHLPKLTPGDLGFEYIETDEREALAETCAEYVRRGRDRPFLLVASFINPHDICYMAIRDSHRNGGERRLIANAGVECRALDRALARPAGMGEEEFFARHCPPVPPNFEPQADEPEAIAALLEQRPFRMKARREWSPRRWREHRWAYARLTEFVDAQIARVLGALRASGRQDRTVVLFTSDHGDMDSAHRMEHKTALYEQPCRIPLILSLPAAIPAPRVDGRHLVSNGLDLLPTICDYAGVQPPGGLAGRSLRALAEGAEPKSWRTVLPLESEIGRGVVGDGVKYVLYDEGAGREQLYDLANDPGEMRNALGDAAAGDAAARMRGELARLFDGAGAGLAATTGPVENPSRRGRAGEAVE